MARLVDVSATVEMAPVAGGAVLMDFSEDAPENDFHALPAKATIGNGARLDRSLELVDWFSLLDAA